MGWKNDETKWRNPLNSFKSSSSDLIIRARSSHDLIWFNFLIHLSHPTLSSIEVWTCIDDGRLCGSEIGRDVPDRPSRRGNNLTNSRVPTSSRRSFGFQTLFSRWEGLSGTFPPISEVYFTFLTFKTSFGMSLIVERWRYRTPLNIWMLFLWFLITNKSIITLVL